MLFRSNSTKIAANQILASHLTAGEVVTLSAQIKDGIITNAKIGTLDANKINAGTLTVKVQSNPASAVGSEKIVVENNVLTVYDESGNVRVLLGKIA